MNTREVMKMVAEDEALRTKIQAECKTPEEAYNALKELGLTDSFEEFKAVAKEIMTKAAEMSFSDVDAVAAAGDDDDTITTVTTTTTVTVGASAAAI